TIFPRLRKKSSRAIIRLLLPRLIREFNDMILETALWFKPDFLLAFKGTYVQPRTLRLLREQGIRLYNYFPDPSPFIYHTISTESLSEYDCFFYTKINWQNERFLANFRSSSFVAHGYDPDVHHPWCLECCEPQTFGHDVTVIATYSAHKEMVFD